VFKLILTTKALMVWLSMRKQYIFVYITNHFTV